MSCEWPVHPGNYQANWRPCGRGGYSDGYGPSLCWQHREQMFQTVARSMHTFGDSGFGDVVEAWLRSGEPQPGDTPEQAEGRATVRRKAVAVVTHACNWYSQDRTLPDFIVEGMSDTIAQVLDRRLSSRWSA